MVFQEQFFCCWLVYTMETANQYAADVHKESALRFVGLMGRDRDVTDDMICWIGFVFRFIGPLVAMVPTGPCRRIPKERFRRRKCDLICGGNIFFYHRLMVK